MPKKKHSILVVERTGALSRVVKDVLAPEEYEVVHALTPAIARQDYASLAPALALISVDIPIASTGEKRANEAYAYCRELGGAGVAVIIVEALATQESVVAAARHGAIDMLVTPVDPKVLSTRIHKALVKIGEDLPEPGEKPKLRFPEDAKVPRKRVEYALRKTQGLLALPHAVKAVLRLCSRPDASAADPVSYTHLRAHET